MNTSGPRAGFGFHARNNADFCQVTHQQHNISSDASLDLNNGYQRLSEDLRQRIAVLIGPYTNKRLHAHRCSDWITKAFGLCWFYDRVVLALPDVNSVKEYVRRANTTTVKIDDDNGTAMTKPQLDILHIAVDPFTDEENEALGNLADFA